MSLLNKLNDAEIYCIKIIKEICTKKDINMYLVGGTVRDLLLNKQVSDIDICIEENPIFIINEIKDKVSNYVYYSEFQTSTLYFSNEVEIDLIRCRKESYKEDGALPEIMPSNIEEDLKRRDFTINSIAYDIINNKLLDLHGGYHDLKRGLIISTHKNSYNEDPSRIFRAVKYANRYDFYIKDKSEIKPHMINDISEDRFVKGITSICREDHWIENIKMLKDIGILDIDEKILGKENLIGDYNNINIRICNTFISLKSHYIKNKFVKSSILEKSLKDSFKHYNNNNKIIKKGLNGNIDNYTIYNNLKNSPYYSLVLLVWDKNINYKVLNYYHNLRKNTIKSNADYLIKNGIKEGKIIGDILEYMKKIKHNTFIDDDHKYLAKNLGEILNGLEHKN